MMRGEPSGDNERVEEGRDEHQRTGLDAEIEGEERERDVAPGQSDPRQSAGEAETMQKAIGEGDQPGPAGGQAGLALVHAGELVGQKDDA